MAGLTRHLRGNECVIEVLVMRKRSKMTTRRRSIYSAIRILILVLGAWTAGCFGTAAWAQADTGRISGVIKDASGALMPGVVVVATRADTGDITTAKTDSTGAYTFPSLRAGQYNVAASVKGFSTEGKDGIEVDDAAAVTVNFEMKAGNQEEVTVVTTTVDQVNTQTGEVSHVIDGDTVRDLALNGRNYLDLLGTLPGSVQAGLGDAMSETTSQSTTSINLNGARATANGLYIDGFINKDIGSNATQFNNVGIDFIEHVRVQTSSFSAQYGSSAGPTINVVTRSGSNKIHGSAFEYIRNNYFDAANYFSKNLATNAAIPTHLRYNDFGFALGGPILHDKLFFFIGTEWKLIAQAVAPSDQTLPLQTALAGNFFYDGACQLSTTFLAAHNVTNCNIAPLITSFGRAFLNEENYVISGATSYKGSDCGSLTCNNGNVIYELPYPYRNHQYTARVDWTINKRNNAYGRWFADTHTTNNPIGDGATPVTGLHDEAPANNVLLSETFVVSPIAINEVSFGALFSSINQQPYGTEWLRSSYGYSYQPYYVNSDKVGVPTISIYGEAVMDSDSFLNRYHPSYFQLQDIYTLIVKRHSLKFGALVGRNRADQNGKANFMGSASFTPTLSANTSGNAVADALLGNFQDYTETPTDAFGQFRLTQEAAYFDDIWRAGAKLSVNFGVRWEHMTPWTAVQDNLSDFYPNKYNPAQAVTVNVDGTIVQGSGNTYNGLERAGSGVPPGQQSKVPYSTAATTLGVPTSGTRGFYQGQNVFMPRVGFAYDLSGNGTTSFRGGVGLFYDTPQANTSFSTLILPPYLPSVNIQNGNMNNIAAAAGVQYPFGAMYTLDPNLQRTYVYQYNFGMQQQLAQALFLQINYVGAEGRHLLRHPDINGVDPSVEDCIVSYYTSTVANGGLNAAAPVLDFMRQYTTQTLPATIKNSAPCQSLPPASSNGYGGYAGYDAIYQWRSDVDYNYNALQANLNRRVGKGRFTLTYTFAKNLSTGSADGDVDHINLYSKTYNYGPTSFDRRNVVTTTYIVQVGPLQRHNLVMREALASWMLTGTGRYQGGTFNTVSGTDEDGVASRANYCGYPVLYGHNPTSWFYTSNPANSPQTVGAGQGNFLAPTIHPPSYYKALGQTGPCNGNYVTGEGNAPVGNVIGPNFVDFDISARKTFELTERYRLTVNFDAFNVLNHPNFNVPTLNVNTTVAPGGSSATIPQQGAYLGIFTAGRPRNLSAGARIIF